MRSIRGRPPERMRRAHCHCVAAAPSSIPSQSTNLGWMYARVQPETSSKGDPWLDDQSMQGRGSRQPISAPTGPLHLPAGTPPATEICAPPGGLTLLPIHPSNDRRGKGEEGQGRQGEAVRGRSAPAFLHGSLAPRSAPAHTRLAFHTDAQ